MSPVTSVGFGASVMSARIPVTKDIKPVIVYQNFAEISFMTKRIQRTTKNTDELRTWATLPANVLSLSGTVAPDH